MVEAIAGAIGALCGIVLILLQRHFARVDSCTDQREAAQKTVREALAEGRITDAGAAAKRLSGLGGALLLLGLAASGCASPTPPPAVVGERIRIVPPGAVITVPPLQSPARQWYLVDDVGLAQWLGIAPR